MLMMLFNWFATDQDVIHMTKIVFNSFQDLGNPLLEALGCWTDPKWETVEAEPAKWGDKDGKFRWLLQ